MKHLFLVIILVFSSHAFADVITLDEADFAQYSNPGTTNLSSTNDIPQIEYNFVNGAGTSGAYETRLTLEAYVASVPLPAAFWLFLSGLIGMVCVARRDS